MTNEEAKNVLSTYRPNGADAGDGCFTEALRQAERDPELARWFEDQRRFDRSMAEALQGIPVPSDAKREVLAAARVESRVRQYPRWIGALAAALVLSAGILFAWFAFDPSERLGRVLAEDGPVAFFADLTAQAMPFGYRADSVAALSAWLESRGAPFPNGLPASMADAEAVGCQVFQQTEGSAVSLLCLVRDGEFVHLFVVGEDDPAFAGLPGNTWIEQDGWNAYSWQREGRGYVALSRAPRSEIEPWFDEA